MQGVKEQTTMDGMIASACVLPIERFASALVTPSKIADDQFLSCLRLSDDWSGEFSLYWNQCFENRKSSLHTT